MDVTSKVEVSIKNVVVTNSDGQEATVQFGATVSEDASDYSVKLRPQTGHHFAIYADLTMKDGGTFAYGDTVSITSNAYAVTGNRTNLGLPVTDWVELKNGNTRIGEWKSEGGATTTWKRTIVIRVNSNAAGKAVLTDCMMDFGTKGVMAWGIGFDCVGRVKIGDTMIGVGILSREKHAFGDGIFQSQSSNNNIVHGIRTGTELYNTLINSRGAEGVQKTIFAEGFYENTTSLVIYRLTGVNATPYSLTEPEGCYVTDFIKPAITSAYTELTPNNGETYEAFKARVKSHPRQYGFYPGGNGIHAVYYGGLIGTDTPKYSDFTEDDITEWCTDMALEQGWYPESDREALTSIYRSAIDGADGHITASHFAVTAFYDTVIEDTYYPVSYTFIYDEGKASEVKRTYTQNVRLTGMFGNIKVKPFAVTIIKFDSESKAPLGGASIKLQIQSGGTWRDYTAGDGGSLIRETGDNGLLTFESLGLGTYRAVEVTAPEGYDLKGSDKYDETLKAVVSDQFTIASSDTEGAKVQISNVRNATRTAQVIYKRRLTNTVLQKDTFEGISGEPMTYNAEPVIQDWIDKGYVLISNGYKEGTLFPEEDTVETFYVLLEREEDMKNIDCSACDDLAKDAPEFIQNGVTANVCASLANDTGLNPSANPLHDNCEDLDKANDCLIGMMDNELEAYDVCDWKPFMHKFIPNTHQVIKAILCSMCGLWSKVHCILKGLRTLAAEVDDIGGAQSFVRYARDNSGLDTSHYRWPMADGKEYTLDYYMDADLDNPGSKAADRDYIVIVNACTDFHNYIKLDLQETWYSSLDTRPIGTIRLRQAQHPTMANVESAVENYSWPVTAAVIVRKGGHLKCNAYCTYAIGNGAEEGVWARIHQIQMVWIPINPVNGTGDIGKIFNEC